MAQAGSNDEKTGVENLVGLPLLKIICGAEIVTKDDLSFFPFVETLVRIFFFWLPASYLKNTY